MVYCLCMWCCSECFTVRGAAVNGLLSVYVVMWCSECFTVGGAAVNGLLSVYVVLQ